MWSQLFRSAQLLGCRSISGLTSQLPIAFSLENSSSIQEVTQQIRAALNHGERPVSTGSESIAFTPEVLTDYVSSYYKSLNNNTQKKRLFFSYLVQHLGPDRDSINEAAIKLTHLYKQERDQASLVRSEAQLKRALSPLYSELFNWLVRKDGGLKLLIDMRSDLLTIIEDDNKKELTSSVTLQELDRQFRNILSQWFSPGFLDLHQITWQSPCDIVEKVSEYEAVHSVRHWKDIKHRVGPYRRVFVFTHRSIPREPIVILHSALTPSPSTNVQSLLNRHTDGVEDLQEISTAVFYSISAAHKGLSGIELGNSLILNVVKALKKEVAALKQFVTLSPIPGFKKWLTAHLLYYTQNPTAEGCKVAKEELQDLMMLYPTQKNHLHALQHALNTSDWTDEVSNVAIALKQPLLSLCAKYLVFEKRRGYAMNPVTNFHIRNGASLWRLNWLADTSPKGLQQSFGIMANYQYDLSCMSNYNQNYILQGTIHYSKNVSELLGDYKC